MSIESVAANEKAAPSRKFPAPCWGQEEALALIEAYRERWYALRRGYLRTADWDAVAAVIAVSYPAEPPKTAAQCRHKIEKLRQRYRAEKQRCLSLSTMQLPSSWFFFHSMDSMENGGGSDSGNIGTPHVQFMASPVIKSVGGRSLVVPVSRLKNSKVEVDPNSMNLGLRGKIPKFEGNYRNPNLGYMDDESDGDGVDEPGFGSGVRFRMPFEEKVVAPILKAKKFGKIQGDYGPNYGGNYGTNQYHMNAYNEELPPGYRVKAKMTKMNTNPNLFYPDGNSRVNNLVRCEMNTDIPNGVPSFGYGLGKKSDRKRGVKRERRGAIDEMVSSIKLLGEGFVRMEKMKMDMAREMEKTRMEMELKRNELILESQRQIVDAFVNVFLENNNDDNKKKKKKETQTTMTTTIEPES